MNGYTVAALLMLACFSIGYGLGKTDTSFENTVRDANEQYEHYRYRPTR